MQKEDEIRPPDVVRFCARLVGDVLAVLSYSPKLHASSEELAEVFMIHY